MSYVKCFSTQPHQFKLTHDISIENFASFDEDEADEGLFPQVDYQANEAYANSDTSAATLDELFNINENDVRESVARRYRNNSLTSSTTSLDSLNQRNASLSSSFVQASADIAPLSKSLHGFSLRIEDVEKISTELVKVDLDKTVFAQDGGVDEKRKRRMSSAFSEEKHLRDKSETDAAPIPQHSCSLQNIQSFQSTGPEFDEGSLVSQGFGSLRRRTRRPRKLPEIPLSARHANPAKRPSKLSGLSPTSPTSLADELQEAILTHVQPDNNLPVMRNKIAIHGRPSSHRHSINLDELGSPDQIDPEHKIKLDESLHSLAGICDDASDETLSELTDNTADVICLRSAYESPRADIPSSRPSALVNKTLADLRNLQTDGLGNLNFSAVPTISRAFLSTNNPYMFDDSSPEEKSIRSPKVSSPSTLSNKSNRSLRRARTDGGLSDDQDTAVMSGMSIAMEQEGRQISSTDTLVDQFLVASTRSSSVSSSGFTHHSFDPEELDLEPTHRGCHKFIPRHDDEIFIEIGDPIYVENEADDLWCEGINLRSGKKGTFPAAYATDLDLLEGEIDGTYKFRLKFLGSVEVTYHKGNDVLCQAINKVVSSQRAELAPTTPPIIFLEINEYGIKMIDRSKKLRKGNGPPSPRKSSLATRILKLLSKEKETKTMTDHFFSLKNVSFCGFHPKNDKYFGFITKHPLEMRFACHVFLSDKTTRPIAEAVGDAFRKFYHEYMAFVHPTEDIYME